MKFTPLLIFILTSCTSLGHKYRPASKISDKHATVYIYRVKKFAGSVGSPYLCLDQQVVGEAKNGAYLKIEIPAGDHELELRVLDNISGTFHFKLAAGTKYFVRFDASMNNGARESAEKATRAGLAAHPPTSAGMGAVSGGMQSAANGFFFANQTEKKSILDQLDTRAQESSLNPGFMFVKPEFAEKEIAETLEFKSPKYAKNYCLHI